MGELVDRDQEHLYLLKLGFYIMAGTAGFFSLFSLLYIGLRGIFASGAIPVKAGSTDDPKFIASIFLGIGIAFLLFGMTVTFLTYFAGRSLAKRRRRILCIVVAGLGAFGSPSARRSVFVPSSC